MTIHHDKFAYGKLKSLGEQMSADSLSAIIKQMNAVSEDTDAGAETAAEQNAGDTDRKANYG